MLPTGKVLYWGFPADPPNVGNGTLWYRRRATGRDAFTDVRRRSSIPTAPVRRLRSLRRSTARGQSFLADGEVLVTGGNLVFPGA